MKKDKSQKNKIRPDYRIIVKDKLGYTPRTVKIFVAQRWVDEDDLVEYLYNPDENFIELLPKDEQDFSRLNEKEIDIKIKELSYKLKKDIEEDNPALNQKNIKFELNKYLAKKRALKYSPNSSYMGFGADGLPEITYLRLGTDYIPFKWDLDTSTVWLNSETKRKKAAISRRNKKQKYSTQDVLTLINLIWTGVLLLGTIGLLWLGGSGVSQLMTTYSESEIAKIQQQCLANTVEATQSIENSARQVETITNILNDRLQNPSTVSGVRPTD